VILAVDTSSDRTSLALARGADLIRSAEMTAHDRRSERLWLDIDALFVASGMRADQVDLYAVCVGPGGFTGLRVGVAALKGLAAATEKPIVGVTSLEAAAFEARPNPTVCSMVGAYKGEVYWQVFELDEEGMPVALSDGCVSTSKQAIEQLRGFEQLTFSGEALKSEAAAIEESAERLAGWQILQERSLVAEAVAGVAFLKLQRGAVDSAESLKAVYVRPAEAEVKLSLGLLGSKIKRSLRTD
jgi:tRNA threonylcarbamoyladenosine biosynthesis protein TsaB